ncbi:polymer biosynthesis protein, WecB/TagA/CpsF family [Cognatiyoonia koreensis]|uniref:Polymer biosynthesis protein, WecB/TagA/CpsF family n=1 Tax=Cognatiyoonia koreensis TaxID=364200 RepID=A0A1I0RSP3_9RHOB|nr:WecB/TagA/CpsF family glycosyltransferase [Cognatiyoonia koreensis]SEW44392.1 polymer biosynthesis protein, WecB/TagA/CpsF family [Cognatiyoonia koreensis]
MMVWSQSEHGDIKVTTSNQASLLADLVARFDAGVGFSVATLNLDHVVKLRRDAAFRQAYSQHTHVTADGNPIVWLSRLAGQDVSLIPGSELITPLAALAATHGVPVALYGSDECSLSQAAAALRQEHPTLEVAFCKSPDMGFDPDGPIATADMKDLNASGAGLCFIALGAPKQERLAARAQKLHPHIGFVSIGAGLNFISGSEKRAPRWVQAIAAEWLWRMMSNPERLAGRYAACILALPRLTVRAISARFSTKSILP